MKRLLTLIALVLITASAYAQEVFVADVAGELAGVLVTFTLDPS